MSQQLINSKWNEVFIQFLDQLIILFPDSPASKIKVQVQLSKMVNNMSPILLFIQNVKGHTKEIMEANEEYFFNSPNIEFVKTLELAKYYNIASEKNRKIIWQYIQTLCLIAEQYKV